MIKSARKSEILSVSAKLFRERGYSAVTMRDIAQALDIKAASLYNHIKSKQEILRDIIIEIAESFTHGMLEIIDSDSSATEKVKLLINLHIDITLRDPNEMACLNNDWIHLEANERTYYLKMREEYEENFRKIILSGIQNKEFKNLNADIIIFSMLSSLRTIYLWYGKKKAVNTLSLKEDIAALLLTGLS